MQKEMKMKIPETKLEFSLECETVYPAQNSIKEITTNVFDMNKDSVLSRKESIKQSSFNDNYDSVYRRRDSSFKQVIKFDSETDFKECNDEDEQEEELVGRKNSILKYLEYQKARNSTNSD